MPAAAPAAAAAPAQATADDGGEGKEGGSEKKVRPLVRRLADLIGRISGKRRSTYHPKSGSQAYHETRHRR